MRYTPTPTSSNTPTPSLTATYTPTNTATGTPCPPSATPTNTTTPTLTPTPTITPTNTVTPGLTPTATQTPTKTGTPTPTPTKTTTPTPTVTPSSPPCVCMSYTIYNNSLEASMSLFWSDCDGNPQSITLGPTLGVSLCACEGTVNTFGGDPDIILMGPCEAPGCICYSYTITNMSSLASMEVYWTTCDGDPIGNILAPETGISFCACQGSVSTIGGDPDIVEYGTCDIPAITPSSTPEPTSTPTPTCPPKGWSINTCSNTCTGGALGVCYCTFDSTIVVYTNCLVTNITDSGTLVYTDSGLTIPYIGFFSRSGSIWYSNSGVTEECVLGGPC
jgi:hypothetical protein